MVLFNQGSFYNNSRFGDDESSYTMSTLRMEDSMKKMMKANIEIRKTFADLKLDYDSHDISIDEKGEDITISFSHSIIKVFC